MENRQSNIAARLPKLKLNEYEMWRIMIEQYFLVQDYALWEIILYVNSLKLGTTTKTNYGKPMVKQNTGPVTSDEKFQKKNYLKARSLLLMTLPKDQILAISKYTTTKTLFEETCSVFGGNDATKRLIKHY